MPTERRAPLTSALCAVERELEDSASGQYLLASLGLMKPQLSEEELRRALSVARRVREGQPVDYVTGSTEFLGVELAVDPRALVPRPETEQLVLLFLREIETVPSPCLLDAGVGSGAVGLALGRARPDASVYGCDSSLPALALAQGNGFCNVALGRWAEPFADGTFQGIVANPPYLTEEEYRAAPLSVRAEPHSSLVSGPSGLEATRALLRSAGRALAPDGVLALETAPDRVTEAARLGEEAGFRVRIETDYDLRPHFLICVR